jgi:hypothetical protein
MAAMKTQLAAKLPVSFAGVSEVWSGSTLVADSTAVLPGQAAPLAVGMLQDLEALLTGPIADAVLSAAEPEGEGLLTAFQPANLQLLDEMFSGLLQHLNADGLDLMTACLSSRPLLACLLGLGTVAASELLRRQRASKEEPDKKLSLAEPALL